MKPIEVNVSTRSSRCFYTQENDNANIIISIHRTAINGNSQDNHTHTSTNL